VQPIRRAIFILSVGVLPVVLLPFRSEGQQPGESAPGPIAPPAAIDSVRPSGEQVDRWIEELSHDAFTVRQEAATRLLEAGMAARAALSKLVDGPDPETRAAARRLVALIDQSEFQRRLEAFAADADGRRGLTLPGWERFRAAVGGEPSDRALFVDMQREESTLLATVFASGAKSPEQLWEDRLMHLVQWPGGIGDRGAAPPLGSCAAVLFLGSSGDLPVSDRGAMLVENLIQRPPIREALAAAGPQDPVRRLVTSWIRDCPNKNELILARRLNLASMIDLKEALPLALAVAGGDPQYASSPPSTRAFAVLLVGQFGSREDVPHLEPLLEDNTICMPLQAQLPGRPAAQVQIRDVVLVVLLHLTGQRPADYGYVHARLQPQRTFQLPTLHRDNDAERATAIAKWHAWRHAQKNSQHPE
jgi:hypothetical protein